MSLKSDSLYHTRTILLVDDDRLVLSTLSSGLTRAGYQVVAVESVDEAETWLDENERPDMVILDVRMPNRNGLELTKRLAELNQIPFMLLTAYSEQEIIAQASAADAVGYLVKPVDISQLIPAVETAISSANNIQSLRNAQQQLQTALDADRAVSVAVGIVMDQHNMNHDDALALLRNTSRSKHLKLIDVASSVVNARETLNLRSGI
ncbi:response regulator [Methylotenera sp.]|uniref:ANTAR domain-containing response regulator n=1 Tax=Methylotenera sp. TaxID=2051956 RepID=UPI002487C10F|nr:response regulator [Methylotenera sp.]MDI1297542.1 response regulator [Methylotenera sp.]